MSTRALRRTLEWVQEQVEDSLDRPFSRDQTALDERRLKDVKEALAEVEAIERAAKALEFEGIGAGVLRRDAKALFSAIAKEAP